MTDQTEREALNLVCIDAVKVWSADQSERLADVLAPALHAAGFHRTPTPHVESDGPEHGHTFEVSVRSRGSSTVIGSGVYRDVNWWSQPMTVRVRAWDGPAALRAAAEVPLGEWDMPDEDTPEPPADGYVSRNVYDYDEPPAEYVPCECDQHGDHGGCYKRCRQYFGCRDDLVTPEPPAGDVTTVEELRSLDGEAIRAACGWVLTVEVGEDTVVLAHGSDTLDWTLWEEDELFPATVLTPAPAPVDVIHLTDFHNPSATAMCGEQTTVVTEHGDTRPVCQTCHRGAMKSAHAGAPIDREALARAIDECPAWRICGYDQQDETPTIREREMVLDAIMPVLDAIEEAR